MLECRDMEDSRNIKNKAEKIKGGLYARWIPPYPRRREDQVLEIYVTFPKCRDYVHLYTYGYLAEEGSTDSIWRELTAGWGTPAMSFRMAGTKEGLADIVEWFMNVVDIEFNAKIGIVTRVEPIPMTRSVGNLNTSSWFRGEWLRCRGGRGNQVLELRTGGDGLNCRDYNRLFSYDRILREIGVEGVWDEVANVNPLQCIRTDKLYDLETRKPGTLVSKEEVVAMVEWFMDTVQKHVGI
jgi:hypothetical protein